MSITYQRDWIVVDFNHNNHIEDWLKDLSDKGYIVHTIDFRKNEFDTEHGKFHRVGTIVAFKPTSVAITVKPGPDVDG